MKTAAAPPQSAVAEALLALAARPRLATVEEIATATGLPVQTAYGFCREGLLPHVRFGRMIRFDPAQVLRFLEAGGTMDPLPERKGGGNGEGA